MNELITYCEAAEFEKEVLNSPIPVAVDFYSDECPPCEALAPIFQRMAEQYRDHIKFVRIFRQTNRDLAARMGIKSSPTVLFFRNGEQVCRPLTGYIKRSELKEAIENVLGETCKRPERTEYECDALVLGGGPAGLTAAIYLARAKMKTVVIDENLPGGQAATTFHISNYPGINGTVRGKDLMNNMVEKAMSFGALIDDMKEVLEVRLQGPNKLVKTEDTDYYAGCVIVATGAEPRKLPAEGEREYRGRGVHYCAACDGAMYQDRKVVVVGGGNSALQEAIFLTRYASHVTVIHQFDHFQASEVLQDELFKHPHIDVIWDTEVRKIQGDISVKSVIIENLKTKGQENFATDGVFVYIGMQPVTNLFRGQLNLNDRGYILTDADLRTNIEGVFAAGDVREKKIRQIATAVGDGATAALMAEHYLMEKKSLRQLSSSQQKKQAVLPKTFA